MPMGDLAAFDDYPPEEDPGYRPATRITVRPPLRFPEDAASEDAALREYARPPTRDDLMSANMPAWTMSAVAQQDVPTPPFDWGKYDREQMARQIAPDPYMPSSVASESERPYVDPLHAKGFMDVGEMSVPTSAWEAGLMGSGIVGKMLPGAGRLLQAMPAAVGIYSSMTGEAEAGKSKVIKGGAKAIKEATKPGFLPGSVLNPTSTAADISARIKAMPKNWRDLPREDAPYPQFAEHYPDTGPPTMVPVDPGKGVGFRPEKTLTPEAEQFSKAREKIIKNMREEGYPPYFDPSQRFPAEFIKQPGPHADTAGALAAKQETIDRHLAAIDTPETRKALRDAYSKGLDLPDSQAWYYLGQVEKQMKRDLGEVAGAKLFRDNIATAMSATTTGMTPQQNLIMAQYLNYLRATGKPFPTASHQTPVTVGGQRTMPNVEAYQQLFGGPDAPYETLQAQAFQNPKRADFAQAQMGNPMAFTVDEQMAHGMIGKDVPQKGTYGLITNIGREEAAKAGADPQRYQDVAWAGFKKMLEDAKRIEKGKDPLGPHAGYQGKPMISEINDMIERTHRLTGMPRREIWERGFLKNEIPLYGVGGALTMGSLAAQDRYQQ